VCVCVCVYVHVCMYVCVRVCVLQQAKKNNATDWDVQVFQEALQCLEHGELLNDNVNDNAN